MKRNLIGILFRLFERDKETIEKTLINFVDEVVLQKSDKYGKVTMIIKYERNDTNETNNN